MKSSWYWKHKLESLTSYKISWTEFYLFVLLRTRISIFIFISFNILLIFEFLLYLWVRLSVLRLEPALSTKVFMNINTTIEVSSQYILSDWCRRFRILNLSVRVIINQIENGFSQRFLRWVINRSFITIIWRLGSRGISIRQSPILLNWYACYIGLVWYCLNHSYYACGQDCLMSVSFLLVALF